MKKLYFVILCVILCINITSCNRKDEIIIGLNYEGSGALAPYGKALLWGAQLAVDEINASGGIDGRYVKLEKADNRSMGAESASAVLYLKSVKGADVIIGPATSTLAKAALSADAEVLIISPSATADELTANTAPLSVCAEGTTSLAEPSVKNIVDSLTSVRDSLCFFRQSHSLNLALRAVVLCPSLAEGNIVCANGTTSLDLQGQHRFSRSENIISSNARTSFLRLCFSDSVQGSAMGEYANSRGFKKAAVIVDMSSDYSVGCATAFRSSFSGEVVFEGRFLSGDTDFFALVTELSKIEFDCVYIPAYYTEAGLFIRQSREQGIEKTFLGGDAMDSPYLADVIGKEEYLCDIIYTDHFSYDDESFKSFAEKYRDRYGEPPPAYSALAYDSVMLYCETLREIGVENIHLVENAIFNTNSYSGVTGEITIKENGDCEKQPVFVSLLD